MGSIQRLTQMTKGSGCGCKIAPALLDQILKLTNRQPQFDKLIAGFETKDDAAIYAFDSENYMISTVDFFTPVVDDPFQFGRVAAANAISDIYAMGGKPLMANAVLGFPSEKLSNEIISQILNGGIEVCNEAGIPLAGGHSIENPEPFFGLSVTGMVKSNHLKKNIGAKKGDILYITKPLGIGVMNTAIKRALASEAHITEHIVNMSKLNKEGFLFGTLPYIHAMTDITGFSLLGHLIEMTEGSGVSAQVYAGEVPMYDFIDEYLKQNCLPDNTYRNWNSYEKKVNGLNEMKMFQILNDPQTNGGLMVSVDSNFETEFNQIVQQQNISCFRIGKIIEEDSFRIYIA
ncbi:MAG: selenide, water dikinase SelD [Bacteroidetes bacterium]|nr:selenide, water dikinase SelD [Bacteroidota bacterium]